MMDSIKETSAIKAPSKLMKKSLRVFKRSCKDSVSRSFSTSSSHDDDTLYPRSSSLTASDAGDDDFLVDKFGFIIDTSETSRETDDGSVREDNDGKLTIKDLGSLFQLHRSSLIKSKTLQAERAPDTKDRGWPAMLGLETIITRKEGVYDDLVAMSDPEKGTIEPDLLAECKSAWDVIERDLKRTFPKHKLFRESQVDNAKGKAEDADDSSEASEEVYGMQALRRVLRAYSVYDKETGYCQGLNFIAGMLIMFLTEEEAFWLLVVVMNEEPFKLREMFSKDMTGTHEILYIADKLVNCFLPELHEHFEDEHIHTSMFTTQWLMTIYTSTFPFELVSRVWDSFLAEGWKIVYKVLVAVLKHALDDGDLLNCNMEQILTYFRSFQSKINADAILTIAEQVPMKQRHIKRYASEFRKLIENGEIAVHEVNNNDCFDRSDSVSIASSLNMGNISKVHKFVIKLKRTKRDISVQDLSPKLVPVLGSAKFAVLLNNALSPEECAGLLKRAKGENFQDIHIGEGEDAIAKFNRAVVDDMELADALYDRVVSAMEDIPELWERFSEASWTKQTSNVPVRAKRLNKKFHFLKYSYGDFTVPLRDGSYSNKEEKSYVSMQVYLNDGFKGGMTSFRGTKKHFDVKAKPGSILLFDQELRHEECEVVKGRRYVLRTEVVFAPHKSDYEYESTL